MDSNKNGPKIVKFFQTAPTWVHHLWRKIRGTQEVVEYYHVGMFKDFDNIIRIENGTFIEEENGECNCLEKSKKKCFSCKYPVDKFREKIPDVTELNKDVEELNFGDKETLVKKKDKKKDKKAKKGKKLKEIFKETLDEEEPVVPKFRKLRSRKRFKKF